MRLKARKRGPSLGARFGSWLGGAIAVGVSEAVAKIAETVIVATYNKIVTRNDAPADEEKEFAFEVLPPCENGCDCDGCKDNS